MQEDLFSMDTYMYMDHCFGTGVGGVLAHFNYNADPNMYNVMQLIFVTSYCERWLEGTRRKVQEEH